MDNLYKEWGTIIEITFSGVLGVVLQVILERLDKLRNRSNTYKAPYFSQIKADVDFENRIIWAILMAIAIGLSIFLYKKAIVLLATILTAIIMQKAYSTWKQEGTGNTSWAMFWLMTFWMGALISYFTDKQVISFLFVGISILIMEFSPRRSDRL